MFSSGDWGCLIVVGSTVTLLSRWSFSFNSYAQQSPPTSHIPTPTFSPIQVPILLSRSCFEEMLKKAVHQTALRKMRIVNNWILTAVVSLHTVTHIFQNETNMTHTTNKKPLKKPKQFSLFCWHLRTSNLLSLGWQMLKWKENCNEIPQSVNACMSQQYSKSLSYPNRIDICQSTAIHCGFI